MKRIVALVLSLMMILGLTTTAFGTQMEQLDNMLYLQIESSTEEPAASATTETGSATIESAKTFDAGVAMYAAMSVMAAAGSAVVLKKTH